MGCGTSSATEDKKSEKALKAALVIQNWYRGYRARLKTRQRYALTIFQSIEYADEQGQLQLSKFFSFMLENYTRVQEKEPGLVTRLFGSSIQDKDRQDYLGLLEVPDSYCGPRLQFPLTFTDIDLLIEAFKQQQILHAYYVLEVLFETKRVLQQMPNFTHTRTSPSKEITICGDLHGKLDDLFLIFYKNGLPSASNPYVFNGDFVDRGKNSMEILMILFVSFLVYPNDLHLNRGNHEDFMMNMRYGFTKEILHKYKLHGKKILQILEEVYTWLPIGTIIDNEVLVIHGGISESTDLNLLHRLERNKMRSVLMPPIPMDGDCAEKKNKLGTTSLLGIRTSGSFSEQLTKQEWEQVVDILWSDPRGKRGCYPNTNRGGGCYFGPDVTAKILNKYHLKMLVRSHECKPDGYEICHDGKVITIFSASNYYEEGSNRGAYIRMSYGTTPRFFQYQITRATCFRPLYQRVNAIESSAIRMLKERMISRKTDLTRAFQLQDRNKSGKLSMGQWAFSMENVLGLNLPWRSLSSHLVTTDKDGNIDYMSGFQDVHIQKPVKEVQSTLIETVYRYRSDLQIIFNIIDSDHSGLISMEEFRCMWKLFKSHYSVHIDDSQFDELAERMDLNKDGSIDFNEFLKAFYVVHKFDKLNKSDNKLA
ncbi:serine/threonine-protein phosphatase with EF-hands 1 isoform X1 [Odocoileus virginianus]|uniref:Serine/threonine-protein phosphatase with EF-hands n=1 Tax=Odocoileus virginianus TaxID=9874 RepID=A0A6J0XAP9_ODOVR|nr:serine/threonine-protein phosphatase with EF-hands 1 [Odocoileus virginianus texanus]XP_020746914.1 serine/threonine-protein phosphatase with EF-hands 1 [Odocoileus virginianus texanus]XP_020746915.1 serine/threonine-protein phosphatase with EF-hands 1 [Odocoileus virginianus texanus]XP_020746916.1 serine/threonine-protein phosphatase with EF-hands 1 [Odocoileus virginianus texanus]XP_020746917.1 serine/threonine-protein phosphatase with EF-hands 1 [Odocoileus virginianus texanus]